MAQQVNTTRLAAWRSLAALPFLCLLASCGTLLSGNSKSPYEMQMSALRAYESGADAEAEALYLGLIRMAPNDPEHLLRLGNLYARSNRPDRAAETYQQALLLNPNDSRLWYNLGLIRMRQGQAALIQTRLITAPDDPLHSKSKALLACPETATGEAVTTESAGN